MNQKKITLGNSTAVCGEINWRWCTVS